MDDTRRWRAQHTTIVGAAITLAILSVWVFDLPATTLFTIGILLVCPAVMVWMMRGMHEGHR